MDSIIRRTALLNVVIMGHYGGAPGLNRLQRDVDKATAGAAAVARRNLAVVSSAAMIPGIAAAGIAHSALQQYSQFTKITEQVRGQTNLTYRQLQTMRGQILGLMKDYGSSVDDISDAYRRAFN